MFKRKFLKCAEDLWKVNQGHLCVYVKEKFSAEKQKVKILNYSQN